jgi:protein-disulfide isomerase
MRRSSLIIISVLALAGAAIAHMLMQVSIDTVTGGNGDTGICAWAHSANSALSCAWAAMSRWSHIGPLSITSIAEAFYATLVLLALGGAMFRERLRGLPGVFLGSSVLAVGYSLFLAAVSAVNAHGCLLCMGLYAVNIGLLVAALLGQPERPGAALRGLLAVPATPAFWATVVLMGAGTFTSHRVYEQARSEAVAKRPPPPPGQPPAPDFVDLKPGDAPGRGPQDAPVTVIEFSDFQCPFCRRLTEGMEQAVQKDPNVRVYFRHFPMDQACNPLIDRPFHEHACDAAYAAVCAGRYGKFWDMHDRLFAHNDKLSRDDLLGYARDLGLDVEAFKACLDDPAIKDAVRKDAEMGIQLGVQGTPTFFVNGHRQVGARSPDELVNLFHQYAPKAPAPASAAPASVPPENAKAP